MDYKDFKKALFTEELDRELKIDPETATMEEVNEMMSKISKYMFDALKDYGISSERALLITKLGIYQAGLYYDLRKKVEDREK